MKTKSQIHRSRCVFASKLFLSIWVASAVGWLGGPAANAAKPAETCEGKDPNPKVKSCQTSSCNIQKESEQIRSQNQRSKTNRAGVTGDRVGKASAIQTGAVENSKGLDDSIEMDRQALLALAPLKDECAKACNEKNLHISDFQNSQIKLEAGQAKVKSEMEKCQQEVKNDIAEVEKSKSELETAKKGSDETKDSSGQQSAPPASQPQNQAGNETPPASTPPATPPAATPAEEEKPEEEAKAEFASCANMTGAVKETCEQNAKDAQLASTCTSDPNAAATAECQAYKNKMCSQDPNSSACASLQSAASCSSTEKTLASNPQSSLLSTYCSACATSANASKYCGSQATATAGVQSAGAGSANFGSSGSGSSSSSGSNASQSDDYKDAIEAGIAAEASKKNNIGSLAVGSGGGSGSSGSSGSGYSYQSKSGFQLSSASPRKTASVSGSATLPGNSEVSAQSVFDLLSVPSEILGQRCSQGQMLHCD